jgi:hypothetical protein
LPRTAQNYLAISYLGDVRSLLQLEGEFPEDIGEVQGLIDGGILADVVRNFRN